MGRKQGRLANPLCFGLLVEVPSTSCFLCSSQSVCRRKMTGPFPCVEEHCIPLVWDATLEIEALFILLLIFLTTTASLRVVLVGHEYLEKNSGRCAGRSLMRVIFYRVLLAWSEEFFEIPSCFPNTSISFCLEQERVSNRYQRVWWNPRLRTKATTY